LSGPIVEASEPILTGFSKAGMEHFARSDRGFFANFTDPTYVAGKLSDERAYTRVAIWPIFTAVFYKIFYGTIHFAVLRGMKSVDKLFMKMYFCIFNNMFY